MLLWAFCFTCSFHEANSVSHNKGTRLHALALAVPGGVTLPDSHSRYSVLTLMLRLITERWKRLLRKDGGRDERNQSWHINARQGSVEANIYNFRLSSVFITGVTTVHQVKGEWSGRRKRRRLLTGHCSSSLKSDRREILVYICCFNQPCVMSSLSRSCAKYLFFSQIHFYVLIDKDGREISKYKAISCLLIALVLFLQRWSGLMWNGRKKGSYNKF